MEAETLLQNLRGWQSQTRHTSHRLDALRQQLQNLPKRQTVTGALKRELEQECGLLRRELEHQRRRNRRAERLLTALPDQRQRLVLSLRYLDGLSWREIAEFFEDTGEPLCERQLYRIHKAALAAVAELDLQSESADDKMEEE